MKHKAQRFYYSLTTAREAAKRRHTGLVRLRARPPYYYVGAPSKSVILRFKEAAVHLGRVPPKVVANYGR